MEGRVMLWCNNHLSTHGMEVHGRRLSAWVLGGDQEYPVLSWIFLVSSQASTMHLHSAAREGAAYRRCHFAAETCPYRDHVGSREAGGSAADSAMGGTE